MAICTSTNAMPGHGEWPLRATQVGFGVKGRVTEGTSRLDDGLAASVAIGNCPGQRNEGRPAAKIDWWRRCGYWFRY